MFIVINLNKLKANLSYIKQRFQQQTVLYVSIGKFIGLKPEICLEIFKRSY